MLRDGRRQRCRREEVAARRSIPLVRLVSWGRLVSFVRSVFFVRLVALLVALARPILLLVVLARPILVQVALARALPLLVLLSSLPIAAACGSAPDEVSDDAGALPVPLGTPVREVPYVPAGDRLVDVELVADLVLGDDPADPARSFRRLRGVAVAGDGRIYVLDGGSDTVRVFDADGEPAGVLGGEGQGPGRLARPLALGVGAGNVVVPDYRGEKLVVWTLDGEHVEDRPAPPGPLRADRFEVLPNGSFVSRFEEGPLDARREVIAHLSPAGREVRRYVEHEAEDLVLLRDRGPGERMAGFAAPAPEATVAVAADGSIYVAVGDEYLVLALDASGGARWALRAPAPREPLPDDFGGWYLEAARQGGADLDRDDFEGWPDAYPALSRIDVDGAGRLWVYPYVVRTPERPGPERVPVDVYSPRGERLFSGLAPDVDWVTAGGEHVYAVEPVGEGRRGVVRYRLVTPF